MLEVCTPVSAILVTGVFITYVGQSVFQENMSQSRTISTYQIDMLLFKCIC